MITNKAGCKGSCCFTSYVKDISLAARIISSFPDYLKKDQIIFTEQGLKEFEDRLSND